MIVYAIVILLIVFYIYKYDICGEELNKLSSYKILCIIFVLLSGLRYRLGLDTLNYSYMFNYEVPLLSMISIDDITDSYSEPLFLLLMSIIKTLFGSFWVLQLVQAAFINVLIFLYIKKHSKNIFCCVLLYFIWKFFTYNMEELRASIAVVICLFANDFVLEKKWAKGVILYLIASLFHYSAIVLVITPFLLFLRFNYKAVIIAFLAYGGGVFLQNYFSDFIFLLSINDIAMDKMENYFDEGTLFSQNVNIFGLIQYFVQFLFYSYFAIMILKRKHSMCVKLEPFVVIGLLFLIMSIPVPLFYRYVNFYTLYFVIFYSDMFVELIGDKKNGLGNLLPPILFYFPLLYFIIMSYTAIDEKAKLPPGTRYIPYSSIIERSLDSDREKYYNAYINHSFSQTDY